MYLIAQISVLAVLFVAVFLWWLYFPYPSPLIRRLLPARKRWPEKQIRGWLKTREPHHGYLKYFYRDPDRSPSSATGFLAPADGLVASAEAVNGIRYVVIALSFWDMHVQRSPTAGRVVEIDVLGNRYMDGEGRNFAFLREKCCPVQKRIVIQTDIGIIAIRLITSLAARRIETWVTVGDEVTRGQRIGRILFGSTVVLEIPAELVLNVALWEHVRAGETVLINQPISPT